MGIVLRRKEGQCCALYANKSSVEIQSWLMTRDGLTRALSAYSANYEKGRQRPHRDARAELQQQLVMPAPGPTDFKTQQEDDIPKEVWQNDAEQISAAAAPDSEAPAAAEEAPVEAEIDSCDL